MSFKYSCFWWRLQEDAVLGGRCLVNAPLPSPRAAAWSRNSALTIIAFRCGSEGVVAAKLSRPCACCSKPLVVHRLLVLPSAW
eukprot:4477740-Pyramimonas_sp.AAC.3